MMLKLVTNEMGILMDEQLGTAGHVLCNRRAPESSSRGEASPWESPCAVTTVVDDVRDREVIKHS